MMGQYHQYLARVMFKSDVRNIYNLYHNICAYDCDVHNWGWYNVCIMQLLYISVITLTNNMQETIHLICCLDTYKKLPF